jgi:thiol-disulfide isomerase/thioredoxin
MRAFKVSMRFPAYLPFAGVLLVWSVAVAQQSALELDGRPADPVKPSSEKIAVLIFVRTDCPVSSRYAPVIQQLREHNLTDTNFFLVFPDKSESAASIRKYVHDFGYKMPALRDPGHVLVKRSQAQFTPEAAVFDRKGELVYHGRIDNLYQAFGRARLAPTTHELEDAIQAALAGRLPAAKEVAGVGCYISDLQ